MRPTLFLVAGLISFSGCQPVERLNGGGSSFVYPVLLKWSRVYAAEHHLQIDYQSTGSGNGIQQMIVGTIQFGCTDVPLNAEQLAKVRELGGEVIHVPLVMGGVVPVYNLAGLPADKPLRFSGQVLAGIFLGAIRDWNHPELVALNPYVNLPNQRILVISRADPSGTTAIYADYLAKIAPELWAEKFMGKPGTSIRFPAGEAQKGSEGVAGLVRRVPGSLGYVELKYALDVGLEYGEVRNRAGQFVRATPESVQAAAAAALEKIPADLCFSITDAPGAESYPIAGTVWAVLYQKQSPIVARQLTQFLRWAADPTGGQQYARELSYAPLPARLIDAIRAKLDTVDPAARDRE